MSGVLGDIKQQLGDLGKQMGQAVVQAPKAAVKTVAQQVGFEIKEGEKKKSANQKPPEINPAAQKANQDFVKELYGAPPNQKPAEQPKDKAATDQQKAAIEMAEANPNKSPEEIQKMMSLKQQLHREYYQKLTTPQGRPEEVQKEQEREAERVERLKMEDLQENKKKEEKKKPIAVLQQERKTEAPMGAG